MHPEHYAVFTASSNCPQLRACGCWVHEASLLAVDRGVIQQKGEASLRRGCTLRPGDTKRQLE
jgi:hypothetical protein